MKIELVQENNLTGVWYSIYIDDKYITGSSNKEKVEEYYLEIKEKYPIVYKKIILKSEEIDVPLEDTKIQ